MLKFFIVSCVLIGTTFAYTGGDITNILNGVNVQITDIFNENKKDINDALNDIHTKIAKVAENAINHSEASGAQYHTSQILTDGVTNIQNIFNDAGSKWNIVAAAADRHIQQYGHHDDDNEVSALIQEAESRIQVDLTSTNAFLVSTLKQAINDVDRIIYKNRGRYGIGSSAIDNVNSVIQTAEQAVINKYYNFYKQSDGTILSAQQLIGNLVQYHNNYYQHHSHSNNGGLLSGLLGILL